MKLLKKFASRKLVVAVVGILATLASGYGVVVPAEAQVNIVNIVLLYLSAQGVVDAVDAYKSTGASDTTPVEDAAKTRKYIKKAKPNEVE